MPNASVDVTIVRDRFNFDWAMNPDNNAPEDTYWWWARSVRAEPNEVIADDGEGNLWSVPFTYDEPTDTVTFAAPVRVREAFVPVQAADGAAASALVSRRRQQVLAAALDRPDKPQKTDPSTPAASRSTNDQEVTTMAIDIAALRSRLQLSEEQLPDDATEEQINALLTLEPDPTPDTDPDPAPEPETPGAEREPEPVAADERIVTMDSGRVAQLEADAAAGRAAREQQIAADRDALVEAAVSDGRIAPASRGAWRSALDARPEAETAALAALTPGSIPVDERGVAASQDDNPSSQQGTGLFDHKFQEA